MTPMLRIHLFGKVTIVDREQNLVTLPAKAQELFCYLLLHNHRPHERENLCTLLWADQSPERSRKYLRQSIWQLQTALRELTGLSDTILTLDGNWVQLTSTETLWLDTDHLVYTYEQVRNLAGPMLTAQHVAQIHDAVSHYHGELLADCYEEWCILERERYQSMVLALFDKLVAHALHHSQYDEGIDYARQILQIDVAREQTHRVLMHLYYLADNRAAALRQFAHCSTILARELNVSPAQRTVALYEEIKADQLAGPWSVDGTDHHDAQVRAQAERPLLATLSQICEQLSTIQQDIRAIKQVLERQGL